MKILRTAMHRNWNIYFNKKKKKLIIKGVNSSVTVFVFYKKVFKMLNSKLEEIKQLLYFEIIITEDKL